MKSTLPNMILSLGLITIVAALLLGGIYMLTTDSVADAEHKAQVDAIAQVAPEFDNNPVEEKSVYKTDAGLEIFIYPARKNGELAGAAVESRTLNGFGGEIVVMCGFNADGTIKDYRVLKHAETAGLGSKMQEWFSTEKGNQSVLGLNMSEGELHVKQDGGNVDAITAATISSRAFLETLNDAYKAYKDMQEKEAR